METERQSGKVEKVRPGYAYIFFTFQRKLFMPLAQWDCARLPVEGEPVTFQIRKNPVQIDDGRHLDYAINVRPVEDTKKASVDVSVLSGRA